MAAHHSKSKKQSGGSERSPSPPEDFVLYLDENLCNSAAIKETLARLGVRFLRHLDRFPRGVPDEDWLPEVGKNGWALLTADKRIRYNFLEKRALEQNSVREFVFASGNLSGGEMAAALELALAKMQKLCVKTKPPFVAAITRKGEVHLRWPKSKGTK
jgi:PIN like domain